MRHVLGIAAIVFYAETGGALADLTVYSKCRFYSDRSLQGNLLELNPGESRNFPRGFDNAVSSLMFVNNCAATIFEERDGKGKVKRFNSKVLDLRSIPLKFDQSSRKWLNWEDQISSATCTCFGN